MNRVRRGLKEVIYEKEKESRGYNRTLRNTTRNRKRGRCCAVNNNRDKAVGEKARNKVTERRSKAISRKFG